MKKLVAFVLLCFSLQAGALELAGVKVADSAHLGNTELKLNGAGIRTKFFFKIYVGALYLAQTTHDAAGVLSDDGAKRVTLVMLRDVDSRRLREGFNDGIEANNTPQVIAALKPQIEQFLDSFGSHDEVREGSVIELNYQPGDGTRVVIDGDEAGHVAGAEFFHALLRVWFGNHPVDADLEKGMLGAAH